MMNKTLFKLIPALRQANCFHWLAIMLIIPAFFVTGCSDDAASPGGSGAETADSSAISLTYHHFTASDDVIILNADTTRIAVSKALADKMGITRFSGRPMAVWQKVNSLPYIRRVSSEMLDNGRYVLTVDKSASLADVLPEDAEINFDTKIHVNHQAAKAWTRAGGINAVEDMSARYMEGDTIHPAVILYTDNGGAGEDVQVTEDMALARSQFTRASGTDGYAYATAEDLDKSDIDWAIVNKDVTLKANIKLDSKADASIGLKVPVKAKVNAKLQLKTGFSFKKGITLKKFDASVLYEGSWKAYGEYRQIENKFSMDVIKGNVNLRTGIGFYVSCDAMIYGFAGPEIAVGPRLGLDADASITVPAKGDPTFAFNASLKCGVQSLIGAKLKIWKWTLADWNTTFAISPQWTIWQYKT